MSQINEFCAYYESMGMLATVLPEPDSRGTSPAMTSSAYSSPAPRAHLYFAPSTATGISVEYA
jgi:hypothetical protein